MAAMRASLALRKPCNIWHNKRLQEDIPRSVRQPERQNENVYVNPPTQRKNVPDEYVFMQAYKERYQAAYSAINKRNKEHGKKTYSIHDRLYQKQYRMREMILQIGTCKNDGKYITAGELQSVTDNMIEHLKKNYPNVHVWGYQIHMDEATPHVHLQYNIETKTKDGIIPNCSQGLKQMGIDTGKGTRHDNALKNWTIQLADEYKKDILIPMGYDINLTTNETEKQNLINDYDKALAAAENALQDKKHELNTYQQVIDEYNAMIEDPENELFKDFMAYKNKQMLSDQIDHDMEHAQASVDAMIDWSR